MSRRKKVANKADRWRFDLATAWPVVVLSLVALVIGGGGSQYGLLNLVVQLVAFGLVLFCLRSPIQRFLELPRPLVVLVLCTIALPLIQLVPVPPFIWHNLPGGELTYAARELVGAEGDWFPISVFPLRTAAAAAALIPAMAMILLYSRESAGARPIYVLLVLLGLASLLAGAIQIAAGQQWLLPYPIIERGRLYGFFANHNSAGLMFVISTCALLGLRFDRVHEPWKWAACLACAAAFVVGVILTQSRSSSALMVLPIGLLIMRTIGELRPQGSGNTPLKYVVGFVGAIIAAIVVLFSNPNAQALLLRFDNLEDSRPQIWEDTLYSIDRFFPMGSGFGTFDEVFELDESLENLLPTVAGRAHNDYLEVGVEAGLFGWALVTAWFIWLAFATRRCWQVNRSITSLGAPMALLVISLQSIVDYPLRNLGLMCLAGLLVGVVAAQAERNRDRLSV